MRGMAGKFALACGYKDEIHSSRGERIGLEWNVATSRASTDDCDY